MKKSFLDTCIKVVFVSIFIFTIVMVVLFCVYGATPDALIQYFFVYVVGELLCAALIKGVKLFMIEKDYEKEDHKTDGDSGSK